MATAAPEPLLYPVFWWAPFYTGSGYSTEAISFVSALVQTELFRPEDVWLSHSGDHILQHVETSLDEATRQLLQAQEYTNLSRRLPKPELERPAIAVCHSHPDCWLMQHDARSMLVPGCPCPPPDMNDLITYRIGRSMFETAGLPAHLVQHCNAMDELWLPTEFNRDTFTQAGVAPEKIRVVPQAIDAADFDPVKHQPLLLKALTSAQLVTGVDNGTAAALEKPYVFLSVFKWEARKGWDVLLDAYLNEFTAGDPVELHIMTKPFGTQKDNIAQQVHAWLARRGVTASHLLSLPKVYVHTAYINDATYRRLYASCDCVVLPSRGEGWGRPQMEAMSMARPLITTNWSGPTAYINKQVAYPLAYDAITAASADMESTNLDASGVNEYFSGQQWAQPSVTHLRELMRRVYTHPAEAAAKGRAARQHILDHFTPDILAGIVMREILRIQQQLGSDRKVPTAEERAARQQSLALCQNYPQLCSQGAAGMEEAAKRAQASFSQFKARHGAGRGLMPGQLTVQELLARDREGRAAMGARAR